MDRRDLLRAAASLPLMKFSTNQFAKAKKR
jgi:hypothetical protein